MIAHGGAWRFLHAPVVDVRDYPDAWEETRDGVARLVARTLWHAYLPLGGVVQDLRAPTQRSADLLRPTSLALSAVNAEGVEIELESIGNDDVPGAISHEVGRAFLAQLARGEGPYRAEASGDADALPSSAQGSIAAVYLGLGVLATNAAHYDQSAGEVRGRDGYHEHRIVRAGGLHVRDMAFLLAVQAAVRDDVLPALEKLRPTQAEHVAAWREVLDDREDELKRLLGLSDEMALEPLSRPASPLAVVARGEIDEANLYKPNLDRRVFRVREHRYGSLIGGALAGFAVGCVAGGLLASVAKEAVPALMFSGPLLGALLMHMKTSDSPVFRCASCDSFVSERAPVCHGCGGAIVAEIANRNERLDREDELEERDRAARANAADRADPESRSA